MSDGIALLSLMMSQPPDTIMHITGIVVKFTGIIRTGPTDPALARHGHVIPSATPRAGQQHGRELDVVVAGFHQQCASDSAIDENTIANIESVIPHTHMSSSFIGYSLPRMAVASPPRLTAVDPPQSPRAPRATGTPTDAGRWRLRRPASTGCPPAAQARGCQTGCRSLLIRLSHPVVLTQVHQHGICRHQPRHERRWGAEQGRGGAEQGHAALAPNVVRIRSSHSLAHSCASFAAWLFSGVSPGLMPRKNRSAGRQDCGFSAPRLSTSHPRAFAIVPTRHAHVPLYVEPSTFPSANAWSRAGTSAGALERTAQRSSRIIVRIAPLRFAPVRIAPVRFAPVRFAPVRFAPLRFASVRIAPVRFASVRFAPLRFASVRIAPVRFASVRFAPLRFASVRFAPVRFAPLRFASVRFAPLRTSFWRASRVSVASTSCNVVPSHHRVILISVIYAASLT